MKNHIIKSVILFFTFTSFGFGQINFVQNFEDAKLMAKEKRLKIYIDFYTSW